MTKEDFEKIYDGCCVVVYNKGDIYDVKIVEVTEEHFVVDFPYIALGTMEVKFSDIESTTIDGMWTKIRVHGGEFSFLKIKTDIVFDEVMDDEVSVPSGYVKIEVPIVDIKGDVFKEYIMNRINNDVCFFEDKEKIRGYKVNVDSNQLLYSLRMDTLSFLRVFFLSKAVLDGGFKEGKAYAYVTQDTLDGFYQLYGVNNPHDLIIKFSNEENYWDAPRDWNGAAEYFFNNWVEDCDRRDYVDEYRYDDDEPTINDCVKIKSL